MNKTKLNRQEKRIFDDLNRAQIDAILSKSKKQVFGKGDIIVTQGQIPQYVYLIEQGRVASFLNDQLGNCSVARIVGPKDFFSYLFCFNRSPAVFDYVAQTAVVLRAIEIQHFEAVVSADCHSLMVMCQILIERLEQSFLLRQETATKHLSKKVVSLIVDLATRFGEQTENGIFLRDFSHGELAACLGASRPKVTLILKQLKESNIVCMSRRGLLLKNMDSLSGYL